MKKTADNNKIENICRRSYNGTVFLLFFLFLCFICKTSLCSKTGTELELQIPPGEKALPAEIITETSAVKPASDQPADSNNYSQKNKIKELTVNKKLVNINTASVDELTGLKGIGKKIAAEIVKFRNETGGFKTSEDIMKVKGIGEKKYSGIKDHIILK